MENRRERYKRKIEYISERISDLPDQTLDKKYLWDVIFYRFYTSIQALMDIFAMLCKDVGISVQDDYSNIEELYRKELFDEEILIKSRKLNGLRNVLVHKYNHIENDLIEQEKDIIISDINQIVKKVEEILDEIL